MRINRPVKYSRIAARAKYYKAHKDMSNIELNTMKTNHNYIYFDIVSQEITNTFTKKHATYNNKFTNKSNEIGDLKLLNCDERKIIFIASQNTDKNCKKLVEANKISTKLNSTVFASNNSGNKEITIHVGDSIPFSNLIANYGSSINQLNNAVFEIDTSGTFKITFILYTAKSSPLGGAEIVVDNVPIDGPTTLNLPGIPLVDHGIFNLKAGKHTVEIVVSGFDLTLCAWKNASIIIEQLN